MMKKTKNTFNTIAIRYLLPFLIVSCPCGAQTPQVRDTLLPYKVTPLDNNENLVLFDNSQVGLIVKEPLAVKQIRKAMAAKSFLVCTYDKATMQIKSVATVATKKTATYDVKQLGVPEMAVPLQPSIPEGELQGIVDFLRSKACVQIQLCNKADPCVPFDWKQNGCNARAHWMRMQLASQFGYDCKKIFLEAADRNLLTVNANDECFKGCIKWGWHVAICVDVLKADGTIEKMVIDPSMFNQAVTEKEWVDAQQSKCCEGCPSGKAGTAYTAPSNQNSPNGHPDNVTETNHLLYKFCRKCYQ